MRKGFTLVELLVVISILGLIVLVAFPAVLKVLNDSKQSAYEDQVAIIEKAAMSWGVSNPSKLPNVNITDSSCTLAATGSQVTSVSVDTLISSGFISNDKVKNPKKTGSNMSGNVKITFVCSKVGGKYVKSGGQYVYTYDRSAD